MRTANAIFVHGLAKLFSAKQVIRIQDLCRAFCCVTVVTMMPRVAPRMRPVAGGLTGRWPRPGWLTGAFALLVVIPRFCLAESPAAGQFRKDVQPILANYCYDCHGDGMAKGNVAF